MAYKELLFLNLMNAHANASKSQMASHKHHATGGQTNGMRFVVKRKSRKEEILGRPPKK